MTEAQWTAKMSDLLKQQKFSAAVSDCHNQQQGSFKIIVKLKNNSVKTQKKKTE